MAPTLQRVLVLAALCLTGCGAASSSARPTPPTARRDRREPARSSPAADPSPAAKPRLPTAFRRPRRASGPIPAAHGRVAGAHILITYAGAIRARPRVPRGRAAARALAAQLARRLCPRPSWARFAAAARTHSDGPTRSRGGLLGAWPPGRMVKPFEAAIASLRHGECRGPVETRFGFHIVLRLDPRRLPTP